MEKDNLMLDDVTVHLMIKNGAKYCEAAIRSIVPHVNRYIIFDTGSTDNTVEIINKIKIEYPQIELYEEKVQQDSIIWDGNHLNQHLTDIRNRMVKMTTS